jgi:serine/threonine protein kinase/lipopolysaccharide biosynthesis regulator YciM
MWGVEAMSRLSPDQWQQVSPYLDQALSLADGKSEAWIESLGAEKPEIAVLLKDLLKERIAAANEQFLEHPPIAHQNSSLAGQAVGAYTLISPIGQGGMGTVWLAERSDGRFERRVAIKFLNFAMAQAGAERFRREGSILARLAHPHIAQVIDAGVTPAGQAYLVLEYCEGERVDGYCDRHKLDVNARVRLFLDILAAAAHAHTNLIVHRDIKPSNVIVAANGNVKLLDFGIAKLLAEDGNPAATQLTLESGAGLTPLFAAPEQLTGGAITTMTDVYALGVLLYLLLTGGHPAGPGPHSPAELIRAITETEPPRVSEAVRSATGTSAATVSVNRSTTPEKLLRQLRGDLDTIIAKALKKNPQERYPSIIAFADDLRRYLHYEPIKARPDTTAYRARKFVRRNRTVVVLAAMALIAIMGGAVGILLQARTARIQRDFALRQLARAEASNELMSFVLSDAAPSGKPFKVNELLDRAEQIVNHQPAGDELTRVELLVSLGEQYANQDETTKAREVLERAYTLSRAVRDPSIRAEAACGLADALARSGETRRAEAIFQEGMREVPGGPEFAGIRSDCLRYGSEVARESGDVNAAIARILEDQRLAQDSIFPDKSLDLNIAIEMADSYRQAGRNREAIAAFEKAGAIITSLGRENTENAVVLFNNWAYALNQSGRPLEAVKLYEKAMKISRDNDSDEAVSPMVLINYAKALHNLGRLSQAADYAERACTKAKEKGFEVVVNQSLLERARVYRDEGDLARSEAMLEQVEPRLSRSLPPGHYAFAILNAEKAQNASRRGAVSAAMRFADEAVAIDEASINSGGEGADVLPSVLHTRAEIEIKAGLIDRAVADESRSIKLLLATIEPGTFSTQLARSYLSLGSALDTQGKHDQARAAFQTASQQFEKTLGPDNPETRNARKLAGQPVAMSVTVATFPS